MTDEVERAFQELQLEYLANLSDRLEELRSDLAQLRAGNLEAGVSLKARLHRLAGSAGSYGFGQLSSLAREAEHRLANERVGVEVEKLQEIVHRLSKVAAEITQKGPKLG